MFEQGRHKPPYTAQRCTVSAAENIFAREKETKKEKQRETEGHNRLLSEGLYFFSSTFHASLVVSNNVAFNDGMMDLPNTASAIYCLHVPAVRFSHSHLGHISISSSIHSPF